MTSGASPQGEACPVIALTMSRIFGAADSTQKRQRTLLGARQPARVSVDNQMFSVGNAYKTELVDEEVRRASSLR
jgi:hypothetical protein